MENPILTLIRSLGLPETRQQYLELAYLERRPYVTAEEELDVPPQFQRLEEEEGALNEP